MAVSWYVNVFANFGKREDEKKKKTKNRSWKNNWWWQYVYLNWWYDKNS